MKKLVSILSIILTSTTLLWAQFEVIGVHNLGHGYYPQINENGTVVTYSTSEDIPNNAPESNGQIFVNNTDLKLNLIINGNTTILTPHGDDVNYIWSSLSPDGNLILFNTCKGTAICDLQGKEIINLGNINAPVWYGSKYVVGMDDNNNGNFYTSSRIVIAAIDGSSKQYLTDDDEIVMYPSVNAENGYIAYNTIDGQLRMMKISTNKLTKDDIEDMILVEAMPPIGKVDKYDPDKPYTEQPKNVRIYINAGRGGWDADDRNIVVEPFAKGDTLGFWESKANLIKAQMLDSMLRQLGFQTKMSRNANNSYNDRSLSAIAAEASFWEADYMLSIHSISGSGNSNYVLQLYAGTDASDTTTYSTTALNTEESRAMANVIAQNLLSNQLTTWTSDTYHVGGDKSYAKTHFGWEDGHGVLRGLTVPGSISFGSMHDYIPETYRLLNSNYLYLEAWNYAKSFYSFFCNKQISTGIIAGQLRDNNNTITDNYWIKKGSKDEYVPINNAKIYLYRYNGVLLDSISTDNLNNGIFVFKNLTTGAYKIKISHPDYYEVEKYVQVNGNQISYENLSLNLKRLDRPAVVAYSPAVELTDSIKTTTAVTIDFNVDMLESSVVDAFSIQPAIEGTLTFENSKHRVRFVPDNGWAEATEYSITLAATACHPDFNNPNTMAQTFNFKFRTEKRKKLDVLLSYPKNNETDVPTNAPLALLFDRTIIDNLSNSLITLQDEEGNNIEIDEKAIKVNSMSSKYGSVFITLPNDLKTQTTYTLLVNKAVSDNSGIELDKDYQITFTTGSHAVLSSNVELLNGMEDIFMIASDDRSQGVDATISIDHTNANEGNRCNKIEYTFAGGQDEMLFMFPTYLNYTYSSDDTLFIDIYGDLSYNRLYVEFLTDGNLVQLPLCDMNYLGWKTHIVPLDDLPQLTTYQFDGIRLERTDNILSQEGTFYIDALRRARRVQTSLFNAENKSIEIAPNPVRSIINIVGTDANCQLSLYSIDGQLIKSVRGMQMDVEGLAPSTYLLRIETNNGSVLKTVIKQ